MILESVKLLILEWFLEINLAIGNKIVKFISIIKSNIYSKENNDIDMRKIPSIVKRNIIYDQNVLDMRWDICKGCEFLTESNRCTKCGCFMKTKHKFKSALCPIGKWGKYKGEEIGITVSN